MEVRHAAPASVEDLRRHEITRLVAAGLVVLVAADVRGPLGSSVGTLAGLALLPVWWAGARPSRAARLVLGLVVASWLSGLWLTWYASGDHAVLDHQVVAWSFSILGLGVAVGAVLWARRLWSTPIVAALFGVGMLLAAADDVGAPNPWKVALGVAVAVVLLGLAWQRRSRATEVVLVLLLGAISAQSDSRSMFAMFVLTAGIVIWQSWTPPPRRTGALGRYLVLLTLLGAAVYSLGEALALEGFLGEDAEQRTAAQVGRSGSLILGARPEIGATLALMQWRPLGFGFGTVPRTDDIMAAKAGMAQLNYDPDNGYVERYMFGGLVELHSMIGDAWALFGIPGFALCAVLTVVLVRALVQHLASRTASALLVFLTVRCLWDMLFGPLYSSLPILALTAGLALHAPVVHRSRSRTGAPSRGAPVKTTVR
ncbi:hypothetical protein GCM10011331_26600 [Flavimobilis marinus]|uniref:O-antigen ligase n=1 Tax=Flavimobilis marinus TaxID=285351 RepID=A0A1I2HCM9_9MICO|nr:hypothetical protein [Flavimobilis marinus]GHG57978.1 hypothetical protein GCM10011331_26600 [Flavimobilis marinus]SFF27308.1 hypothetical protein SAMN04488035_2232 [Flavimobilis marinus]